MDINELLRTAHSMGASDIHLKVGSNPIVRINGELCPLADENRLTQEDTLKVAYTVMSPGQREIFKKKNDIDLAYSVPGLGRFRCNIFIQRGTIGLVFRLIPMKIPTLEELFLPEILRKIAMEERGLILVTGTTGSGKSTTIATMIDHINANRTDHIMTIEDPIEYLHRDKRSIINQREVGNDTESFGKALRASLRQDPDVILVGEMRVQLASVLGSIISMRLVPRADGKGRVPAVEILIATSTIRDCILDPDKTKLIHDAIAQGAVHYGMQTFDQSLFNLFKSGYVTYEEAMRRATNPDDFALKVKGIQSTSELAFEETEKKDDMKIDRFAR
jgi:twitching motility protein PilT